MTLITLSFCHRSLRRRALTLSFGRPSPSGRGSEGEGQVKSHD